MSIELEQAEDWHSGACKKSMAKKPITQEMLDAMMCAFNEAADGLLIWEFGGAESKEEHDLHKDAAAAVSKKIREMGERFYRRESFRIENRS
jgi:hypothetical protein